MASSYLKKQYLPSYNHNYIAPTVKLFLVNSWVKTITLIIFYKCVCQLTTSAKTNRYDLNDLKLQNLICSNFTCLLIILTSQLPQIVTLLTV